MVNCTFCGNLITPGTGKIFVENTGRIFNFCSNKCEKNMLKLKRKNIKLKWTKFYEKGKK
ncbi:MAG: 50S ribosomal protein L24e [Nanoarchaeota archaeon]